MEIGKGTVRRAELLNTLRSSSEPLTAGELAKLFSLHVSTVRFHLDALIAAGAVTTEFEKKPVRGRPRRLYSALVPAERVGYQKLAEILASQWATPGADPIERAVAAGGQWATQGPPAVGARPRTLADAAASASAMFGEIGFEPETMADNNEIRIRLHACPFEFVARTNPDVVCSVHLGLLRGILDRAQVPGAEGELIPWDTPQTCVAVVTRPAIAQPGPAGDRR